MKKTLLILSFILLSVVSFAQRQRTTAVFDSDTTTRPKAGFYGIGVRANNIYFVPPTGNNIRLANYSLFTGLTTNYLSKWNGSKLVNSAIYESGGNVGIGTASPSAKLHVSGDSYISSLLNVGISSLNSKILGYSTTPTERAGRFVQNSSSAGAIAALQAVSAATGGSAFDAGNWNTSSSNWVIRAYSNVSRSDNDNVNSSGAAFLFGVRADGNVGINTTMPTSKLQVVGLPTYADNTAATIGGLTVGAFYRTVLGVLMVVY